MLKKKNNYKLIIGLILGILLVIPAAFSATIITANSNQVSYNPSGVFLTSNTVQGALDELYNDCCPSGYNCSNLPNVKPGDYISYTPPKTSYTTSTDFTGMNSTVTINPSQLNLWRVLRINSDGTVDIISEYTSNYINLYNRNDNQIAYQYYIGLLNILASQYEDPNYTIGSRMPGYDGTQTEFITDNSMLNASSAPWNCSTTGSCHPENYESQGGGDTGYISEYNLIVNALHTAKAKNIIYNTKSNYWLASRNYVYKNSNAFSFNGRYINGEGAHQGDLTLYSVSVSGLYIVSAGIRPIVTLKAGLIYSGAGTSSNPKTISLGT